MNRGEVAWPVGGVELKGDSDPPSSGRRAPHGKALAGPAVTAAQMAQVDRRAMRGYGIGLTQMMELAGRNLGERARQMLGGSVDGRTVVVLCGLGNNGGGGMVAARHLHRWGAQVQAVLTGAESSLKAVPNRQWRILKRLGLADRAKTGPGSGRPDLIIDAILGYGFHGRPRSRTARWIEWANSRGCPILALDLPSGLDATTGIPSIPCIRAKATLTLALPKTGLLAPEASAYTGDVYLADIGIPAEVYRGLGYEVGHLFANGAIVSLEELKESWMRAGVGPERPADRGLRADFGLDGRGRRSV